VQPIVTPAEMAAIDKAAPEPVEELIERAGTAVARAALQLLGGAYGRRVTVVAGKGNNGNDGRAAAARLQRAGVRVDVLDAATVDGDTAIIGADLVIDAAYGTGFHGSYAAPDPGAAPVLAIDIPSGVDGSTGEARDDAVTADATVTFAALKPGVLFHPGRARAGRVRVADIGLDCSSASAHLVEASDVRAWLPARPTESHKWKAAVWIVAGSPGMTGAAVLSCRGAQRTGAGYVRLSAPGATAVDDAPVEVVHTEVATKQWDRDVARDIERFKALVVGPGLGTGDTTRKAVRRVVAGTDVPKVVDGDGLTALGAKASRFTSASCVLTPHDGEYARLAGRPPAADRIVAARELATTTGATVLLKGPTTVVADSAGRVLVVLAPDARLATAGTGDVLSGIIGALLAQGVHPLHAAAAGAWLHARAATLGPRRGLVAGDVAAWLPAVFDELEEASV
jgi:NAD(P)H-hydrate epimerase